jgi:hypothetical protein
MISVVLPARQFHGSSSHLHEVLHLRQPLD